jgi:hypothetical protein
MMNPWVILAIVLTLGATHTGAYTLGYGNGVNAQKVADQEQFDKLNKDIADQKAQANAKYRDALGSIIALQTERDKFKNQLGEQREKNREVTTKLADAYAAYQLRFSVTEVARCWRGGRYTQGAECDAASPAKTTTVQLPDAITANLRRLAKDADELNDDYKACYAYANQVISPETPHVLPKQ